MINDQEFFGFCDRFKHLGTTFSNTLDDSADVKERINKASRPFGAMRRTLTNHDMPDTLRVKACEATVLNILLFGCESWALKEADRRSLEATHHNFLRSILRISMFDVKECRIRNDCIREHLGCNSIFQHMELRRARWLEKIANMPNTRNPRKILVAWTPQPRPVGRPQQTIRHGYATTVESSFQFPNSGFDSWFNAARNHHEWANQVEQSLQLESGIYKPFKKRRLMF